MTNEPEWRDANPASENMPNRGRSAIILIAGGVALGVLAIVGMRVKPVGLAVGVFTFVSGLTMLVRKRQFFYKPGLIVAGCGFLLLLANPRFGVVAAFASFFVIVVAVGLVVFGLFKAIKLAWELGKLS
ncbi:MAG: hypothetical protein FWC22_04210 [Treponema sp.]|nr:hypothetical protein [Treponema sp.]